MIKMRITIAENAGTCFGVDKAIKTAFETAENSNGNTYVLGELVHNPYIVNQLKINGIKSIDDYKQLKSGDRVIIRAHGERKKVYDYCKENNIEIIDCTCPYVKKSQHIAKKFDDNNYQVVVVGSSEHPEIKSVLSHTKNGIAFRFPEDVDLRLISEKKVGVLAQTTQKIDNFRETVCKIMGKPEILKVHNTICSATDERQKSAIKLAKKSDVMIVIGGANSSNTRKLYELSKEITTSHIIEDESELKEEWFDGMEEVGVTAGASTPDIVIDQVVKKIESYSK